MKLSFKLKASSALLSAALLAAASSPAMAKEFKISLGGGEGTAQHALAAKFVEGLEANTEHTARIYSNSQLGSEQDTVNDASMGVLDFSVVAINNITPFSPTVGVFTLPYIIETLEEAETLVQSPAAQELIENTVRDAGVRIVGWTFSGFRVLTNSKRPVEGLADLQNLVIRVPKNEIMIDTYRAWGVNPTPMAWAELFSALQQKVVDGQDLALVDIASLKFYEVQKYITNIHYNFLLEPMIISEGVFQDQSEADQAAILAAGKEATLYSAEFLRSSEADAIAKLKEKGMEFFDVDESEWIEKATTTVWPKYYDSVGGKDKVDAVIAALGR
ncbi:TRAP transporter substrate-binding protein [Granulosicoccus antarcticus]|uniref:Solute-binding protein n=1 Tax=Granulosicoccus antarcticus IMCC3135 TaxID=1192854 RepID=A0A2Z2NYC2_9GAMM|nr:TRAP transporter substrate-binding protein [Granulosicoccus antarcticus]ASJ73850.1 Solute-binding protein [Granulosicoccus antarcticus IMCC3135]